MGGDDCVAAIARRPADMNSDYAKITPAPFFDSPFN
jgi:hypothetical protein